MKVALVKFGDVALELAAATDGQAPEFEGGNRYVRDFMAETEGHDRLLLALGETDSEHRHEDVVAFSRRIPPARFAVAGLMSVLRGVRWIGKHLNAFRPDVIVCLDTAYPALACLGYARRTGARLIVVATTDTAGRGKGRHVRAFIARRLMFSAHAHAALACTSSVAQQMKGMARPGLAVSTYYPDYRTLFANPRPQVPAEQRSREVLFVGRLAPVKGSRDLARLAVAARQADGVLVVAGDGPDRAKVESDALKLGVRAHLYLEGTMSHQQVLERMTTARVVIVPSRSEGVAKVALEAILSGTPVVAYAVGGLPDTVSHRVTGVLAPAGDVSALAAAVEELLLDDGSYQTLLSSVDEARIQLFNREPTFGQALGVALRGVL